MGFSDGSLAHFVRLGRAGKIKPHARVLEFGSQDIYGELPDRLIRDLMQTFGASGSPQLPAGCKSERLLRAVGFDYTAFDVYESEGTRVFDLNSDSITTDELGKFDVVTNFGTSEHVANQFNVFKVAHDALRVGGVMINGVPFYGHINHGLFNYHPKFFTSLIKRNRYETLSFGFSDIYSGGDIDRYQDTTSADNGNKWANKYVGCAQLTVIFQKTIDAPFQPPVDTGEYTQIHEIYKR